MKNEKEKDIRFYTLDFVMFCFYALLSFFVLTICVQWIICEDITLIEAISSIIHHKGPQGC